MITGSVSTWKLTPHATNGLQWFFGTVSDSLAMPAGSGVCIAYPSAGPGATVDSTHHILDLVNTGTASLTADISILVKG